MVSLAPLARFFVTVSTMPLYVSAGISSVPSTRFTAPSLRAVVLTRYLPEARSSRDLGVFGEGRSLLEQAVGLHREHALLREDHRLVEHRAVLEDEHHAALHLAAAHELQQVAGADLGGVDGAQGEEAVAHALREAHGDRFGGGRRDEQAGEECQRSAPSHSPTFRGGAGRRAADETRCGPRRSTRRPASRGRRAQARRCGHDGSG